MTWDEIKLNIRNIEIRCQKKEKKILWQIVLNATSRKDFQKSFGVRLVTTKIELDKNS